MQSSFPCRSCWLVAILISMLLPLHAIGQVHQSIRLRVVGGKDEEPIRSLRIDFCRGSNKDIAATFHTGMGGFADVSLRPGVYYVRFGIEKEIPFLPLPIDYDAHPAIYRRWIRVEEDDEPKDVTFILADACKLTLRAVDVETGEGIPGVTFATENADAEQWAQPINGDNLGSGPPAQKLEDKSLQTNEEGVFERYVGPREGWVYFIWDIPERYERVGEQQDIEVDTAIGRRSAEHVFKLRKRD